MSELDSDFTSTSIGDADSWEFVDGRLNNLVELVDEYGADAVYSMDPSDVSEHVFGDRTSVDVDVNGDHYEKLGAVSKKFVDNFCDVASPKPVSELYDDPGAFNELVRTEVGDSADPDAIRAAIDQKNR